MAIKMFIDFDSASFGIVEAVLLKIRMPSCEEGKTAKVITGISYVLICSAIRGIELGPVAPPEDVIRKQASAPLIFFAILLVSFFFSQYFLYFLL